MGNGKEVLNPPAWKRPRGFSHLVKATGTTILFAAGQTARDTEGNIIGVGDICQQYEQILKNIQEIMSTGGAAMSDIVRLTIYCTNRDAYLEKGKECSQIYKKYFGDYYPAMTF